MKHNKKQHRAPQARKPSGNSRTASGPPSPPAKKFVRVGESYTGILQASSERGGFVVLETPGFEDIFVPAQACGPALHGDQVRVEALYARPGRATEGRVVKVLRHANTHIVGQLKRAGKYCFVIPRNEKIRRQVEIRRRIPIEEAPDNAWVVVEVQTWSNTPATPLVGKLTEVLGTDKDRRLPILLLIREGGIQPGFPAEVDAEAAALAKRPVTEAEIKRRRDFRGDRVFTIDPATAKDFDDAVSLVEKRRDGWRVAVHIADVAHYVRPGTKLDEEAYDRATSIYPVDRVIPMLPEELSNHLCSLRPGEDKFTMTAVFDVSHHGEVTNVELCESIIHSVRRFNYEEVEGIFNRVDGVEEQRFPTPIIPDALMHDLMEIRAASAALLKTRMKRGALDMDLPETSVVFDADGIVCDVRRKERIESNRLIEDLMISANEAVARELLKHELPALYRVHESPSDDKLSALAPVLGQFGIQLPRGALMTQGALQAALEKAQKHPAGAVVQRLVLRAMMRAQYRSQNLGHFGLASKCYAHFTSPIRRYPDLIVHRGVKALLGSRTDRDKYAAFASSRIDEWGRHTSQREERAQRIEWDAVKILTMEFMKRFVGDVCEGFVAGMMGRGLFIELVDYPAEGFIPASSMTDDFYEYDDTTMTFFGRRNGRAFHLGDRVRVQIERIDVLAGKMDLVLVRPEEDVRRKGGWPKPPKNAGNRPRKGMEKRAGKRRR